MTRFPRLAFDAELWEAPGDGAWVFVTLPVDASEAIRDTPRPPRRGFGSLRVDATIGSTTWSTSIFPDSKRNAYVLPVKRKVREAEQLEVGGTARVALELLD